MAGSAKRQRLFGNAACTSLSKAELATDAHGQVLDGGSQSCFLVKAKDSPEFVLVGPWLKEGSKAVWPQTHMDKGWTVDLRLRAYC